MRKMPIIKEAAKKRRTSKNSKPSASAVFLKKAATMMIAQNIVEQLAELYRDCDVKIVFIDKNDRRKKIYFPNEKK